VARETRVLINTTNVPRKLKVKTLRFSGNYKLKVKLTLKKKNEINEIQEITF
jgi:hypothetical protein